MTPDEVAAHAAIRNLVATYSHLADGGRFEELIALFAPDGELRAGDAPVARGPEGLRAFFTGTGESLGHSRPARVLRHHVTSHRIETVSGEQARGAAYFLVLTERGLDHWGRYRDEYVRIGDLWLFQSRRARLDGFAADSWTAARRRAGAGEPGTG